MTDNILIKTKKVYKTDYLLESINADSLTEKKYLYQFEEYDERSNLIMETTYTMQGAVEEKIARVYDNKSRIIEEHIYYTDEEIVEKKYFTYEEEKLIQERIVFEEGGESTVEYTYENDNIVKKEVISDGELEEKVLYKYEDMQTTIEYYDEDELVSTERKITDDKGNIIRAEREEEFQDFIEEYEYNADGKRIAMQQIINAELQNRREFTYNDKGEISKVYEKTPTEERYTEIVFDQQMNPVVQLERDKDGNILTKVERNFNDKNLVVDTVVDIDELQAGVTAKYRLSYEYQYHNI